MAEDLIAGHVGTVPTVMSELVPALAQTQRGALADRRHRVRRFSALLALTFRQSGDATADSRADHHRADHPGIKRSVVRNVSEKVNEYFGRQNNRNYFDTVENFIVCLRFRLLIT